MNEKVKIIDQETNMQGTRREKIRWIERGRKEKKVDGTELKMKGLG
jgi:hypothetical protein